MLCIYAYLLPFKFWLSAVGSELSGIEECYLLVQLVVGHVLFRAFEA